MKIQNLNLKTYKNDYRIIQNKKERNDSDFSLQSYPKIDNKHLLAFRGINLNSQLQDDLWNFCHKKGKVTKFSLCILHICASKCL